MFALGCGGIVTTTVTQDQDQDQTSSPRSLLHGDWKHHLRTDDMGFVETCIVQTPLFIESVFQFLVGG